MSPTMPVMWTLMMALVFGVISFSTESGSGPTVSRCRSVGAIVGRRLGFWAPVDCEFVHRVTGLPDFSASTSGQRHQELSNIGGPPRWHQAGRFSMYK